MQNQYSRIISAAFCALLYCVTPHTSAAFECARTYNFFESYDLAESVIQGKVIDIIPLKGDTTHKKIVFSVDRWLKGQGPKKIEVLGGDPFVIDERYYAYIAKRKLTPSPARKIMPVHTEVKYGFDGHMCGSVPYVHIIH